MATVSMRSLLGCIGVDTTQEVSVLGHVFGFARRRMPRDPDAAAVSSVSVRQQMLALQGRHLHLNVIRVGYDGIAAGNRDAEVEKLDYAVYKTRNIYRTVSLGIGRVEHFAIDTADANGRDDIGSADEADALSDEWSVPNDGIDVFVVRNISADFVGISPRPGSCEKGPDNDGLVGGESGRGFEAVARTFAHEVGHFLNLPHNHGDDCPTTTAGQNNLMAQTRCALSTRDSVLLTGAQGTTMRGRCQVRPGC
jgi:hypothetical protein